MLYIFRFDFSGKCNNETMREELEEKRRAQVSLLSDWGFFASISHVTRLYKIAHWFGFAGGGETAYYIASFSTKKNESRC